MQSTSLVNIKAIDITRLIGESGLFYLTSYNQPIAIVIPPHFRSKKEFYALIEKLSNELFGEQHALPKES